MKAAETTRAGRESKPDERDLPLWVRATSLALCLFLAGSVVVGMPLHGSDGGCNMADEMSCCHEGMESSKSEIPAVDLCCVLDCQEPAPTGSTFTPRNPSLSGAFLEQVRSVQPLQWTTTQRFLSWYDYSAFKPPDTYLRNLALLI